MKRAALVITDAKFVWGNSVGEGEFDMPTSEQLLADLRTLTDWNTTDQDWLAPAARVRALLPEEEGDDGE